jgi:hypothetical protein
MKKKDKSSSSRHSLFEISDRREEISPRSASNFPPPTLQVEGVEKYQQILSLDVNITIRSKVQLTRRQATILSGQALFEVLHFGLTLGDWMVLEFLYNFLIGQKPDFLKVKDPKELEILALLKIILLSGTWLGLEGKVEIPEDIQFLLRSSRWIPNERTYHSRKQLFDLKKYLQVRIVSVDDLMTRSSDTKRYSSYCKGYGEGSSSGRREKTPPSAELDGEEVRYDEEDQVFVPISATTILSNLFLLEVRRKISTFK